MNDDDMLLGIIGMNNVAVVKVGNGIFVYPLSEDQKIKERGPRLVHKK